MESKTDMAERRKGNGREGGRKGWRGRSYIKWEWEMEGHEKGVTQGNGNEDA